MAEAAASAIGIAGVVNILQNLLQCYKDFLTARNFENDFAYIHVRTALLHNSTATWAIAVGLIDDSETPTNKFLVAEPTEARATLAKKALGLIRDRLAATNAMLDTYATLISTDTSTNVKEFPVPDGQDDKLSGVKRIVNKLYHATCSKRDGQTPGILKKTEWALVNKAKLEENLDQATTLMNQLNIDFAPINQKQQLEIYCQYIKDLGLNEEDLRATEEIAGDLISKRVLKMIENERLFGNKFAGIHVTQEGRISFGDFYDTDWRGSNTVRQQQSRNDIYGSLSVADTAFVTIGDTFGGQHPMSVRLAQLQAAKQNKSGRSPD